MKVINELIGEFHSRWDIFKNRNGNCSGIQRMFAVVEIICFPLSMLSIFVALPLQIILICANISIPEIWLKYLSPVLLTGAIGYLTNWLAIMMLFRPYDPIKWLVLWPQGMVPRNKSGVAKAMGDQVGNKLLAPEKIADEISGKVIGYLSRPDVIASIKGNFQSFLHHHQESIIAFLIPQVEESLVKGIDKIITPENIKNFWATELEPRLKDENTRDNLANAIIAFGQENASELVAALRCKLRIYLEEKIGLFPFSEKIIDFVMTFFANTATMKEMVRNWLCDHKTINMLKDKTIVVAEKFSEWLETPEANDKLNSFSAESRLKMRHFLSEYLRTALPEFTRNALESEKLWGWIEDKLLPEAQNKLIAFIHERKQEIINNLKLAQRIEDAINAQDVRKFHEMINNIAAQHLGAIQVLGFVLGILIGGIQLIQTMLFN